MEAAAKDTGQHKSLTDFKPLKRVVVPDIGDLRTSGLVLIVGPNSSGKTQLLQDISARLSGEYRKLVVATTIEVTKPDFGPFIAALKDERFIEERPDPNGRILLVPITTYTGISQAAPTITPDDARNYYASFDAENPPRENMRNAFLTHFGRFLVAVLFLGNRLTAMTDVGMIAFETQSPQHDLHALHVHENAGRKLSAEIFRSFGKSVWMDISSGNLVRMRVADGPLPPADDRHSFAKMRNYRTIQQEGDGLKSYTAICVPLLLGDRPVCLIDEPEMCLHPPQAYNLGGFIGQNAATHKTATLVSTHSSHVLRGVIQATRDVEIIRMTRVDGAFHGHRLSAAQLSDALKKPTLRAESVLDGIFSESVVIVEADNDRLVYNTAWERLGLRFDLHFAAVGGYGGVADASKLYRSLRIPVAVIVDRDVVADCETLSRIIEVMTDRESAKRVVQKARSLAEEIRKIPPSIEPNEYKARLDEITALPTVWENGDDGPIRRQLSDLSDDLYRMRRLKHGPIDELPSQVAGPLGELLEMLSAMGVFVVPVGQLEDWLPPGKISTSKKNKSAWANEAASVIQAETPDNDGIWRFLRDIEVYLKTVRSHPPKR